MSNGKLPKHRAVLSVNVKDVKFPENPHTAARRCYNRRVKLSVKKPSLMLVLSLGFLALLPILAVLQYLWMGKVSEAERARMQANLREGASKFTGDFDREIARLFLGFQGDDTANLGKSYFECYARWQQQTAFQKLINGIYFLDADDKNQAVLKRLNLTNGGLEPGEWKAELANLKQKFEMECQRETLSPGLPIPPIKISENVPKMVQIYKGELDPIQTEIPAVVIHRLHEKMAGGAAILPFQSHSYTILTLDLDYIKQDIIPQLAARYFSGNTGLDYNLTIVNAKDPQQIVYQSDAMALNPTSTSDATANLFNIRLSELNTVVKERVSETRSDGKNLHPSNRVAVQIYRSDKDAEDGNKVFGGGPMLISNSGRWQLLLKHHAGSLDAVVAGARRRNLAISFGILILLAAAVGLILISTNRARNLARQQMEFVAGVSHELRTPLTVIRSAGENLADGVIGEKQQIQRYGKLIATEGRRLTDMVEQILEFSGIQSGRKNYHLRLAPVMHIVDHALTGCHTMIEEGGFEIHKEIERDLPLVAVDEAALSRSIQNLLTNAMKYSGDSRRIEIKARSRRATNKTQVEITVMDTGLGIEAAELPHIFEPFYRGREATAAQIHGSGLGLSLVKQIIEAHNGNVSVTSEPGKGSAFTLHLPAVKSLESSESLESLERVTSEGAGVKG